MARQRNLEKLADPTVVLEPDTRMAEAMNLPVTARRGARPAPIEDEDDPNFQAEAPPFASANEQDDDQDPDIADANNPDVTNFGEPPLVGGRSPSSDMFGTSAETFGRVTSPKLYAQASQFPTAVQYRVWRWENGIPVAIGAIDAEATEEDFVKQFYNAMPVPGDGRFQFRFRPVDIRGQELGKEFTLNFSEHHTEVARIRQQKEREREEKMNNGRNDPLIINQGDGTGGQAYAEEMGRMFEQAVESAERRTDVLQQTLESERERLREEEKARYQERANLADRSADVVTKMTEKVMQSDRLRSEEQLQAQASQSKMMIDMVTTTFAQQQQSAAAQAERQREADRIATERQREADGAKLTQDREFFDRQRQELEARRTAERQEAETRRLAERDESERKHRAQMEEWDRKREIDKQEAEARLQSERARLALEQTRIEEQRKFELEQLRLDATKLSTEAERRRTVEAMELEHKRERDKEEFLRREQEAERRRQVEREEMQVRLEREKLELARQQELAREERERWRTELEEKRRVEREEWERKRAQEKDEAERRERADRERMDRERQDFQVRMEREKTDSERREALRREEMEKESTRHREEMALQQRQAELRRDQEKQEAERREQARKDDMEKESARRKDELAFQQEQMRLAQLRDQQHADRQLELARMEREAVRETQLQREKQDREAREYSDKERERQQQLVMKQLENDRDQAREHQERLAQIEKVKAGGGLGSLGDTLDMSQAEILAKIFGNGGGGDGEDKNGWAEAIPKVLATLAELGKAAMSAKAEQIHVEQRGRRQIQPMQDQQLQARMIQTPDGPRVILPGSNTGIPLVQPQARQPQRPPLPREAQVPEQFRNPFPDDEEVPSSTPVQAPAPTPEPVQVEAPEPVNTLARAKAAGIALLPQKKARKAIRALSEKLAETEQEGWLGAITEAITKEVGIFHYIKAVTVRAALSEATPDASLQEAIVKAMKESGMIPADVPYDEADYARIQAEKAVPGGVS